MEPEKLIETLAVAERLKDATRHCYTSRGRRESVAEHSWRITLMAYLVSDEFPEADLKKLMKMCLIHDLGEAFTGDIPTFEKSEKDEEKEASLHIRTESYQNAHCNRERVKHLSHCRNYCHPRKICKIRYKKIFYTFQSSRSCHRINRDHD